MTRRFRRFVFWIFFIFFIFASVIITLLAQGWRFDLKTFKTVKTGGIFIKSSVSEVKIYINDKYVGSTGGILNYTKLIDDLTPKKYNVFLYKEEYYPWNKTVEVKNGLVSELISVVLLPLDLKRDKITELPIQAIYDFSVDNGMIKIVNTKKTGVAKTYDMNGNFISNEKIKVATSTELISPDKNKKLYNGDSQIWIDYLNSTKEEPLKMAGEKEMIIASEKPILFLDWFKDSEHMMWLTENELNIAERDNRGGKRNSVKYYLNIVSPIFWDNKNFNLYFFETNKEKIILYKINME